MPDDLEQELRSLTPIPPTPALDAKIAHHLRHSEFRATSLSDKLLLTTLSLAAAAALFIITLITSDYLSTPAAPPTQVAIDSPASTPSAQAQQLLAQLTDDRNAGILPASQTTQPRF